MNGQDSGVPSAGPPPPVDPTIPNTARRYNYWLGGKDHFAADRASGDAMAAAFPTMRIAAIENRRFLRRAVTFLTAEAGVRQFIDIGAGIPAPDNTHEVAQAIASTSRVVYVDNDPVVMAHARALLDSTPEGMTTYLESDLLRGAALLRDPVVVETFDLSQPVALLLVAVLHFLRDVDDPYGVVADLVRALPRGSYLVASHASVELMPPDIRANAEAAAASGRHGMLVSRSREEFAHFFDGLDAVPPGIVSVTNWRDAGEPRPRPTPAEASAYSAVARIP